MGQTTANGALLEVPSCSCWRWILKCTAARLVHPFFLVILCHLFSQSGTVTIIGHTACLQKSCLGKYLRAHRVKPNLGNDILLWDWCYAGGGTCYQFPVATTRGRGGSVNHLELAANKQRHRATNARGEAKTNA